MTVDINKPCWTKRGGVVTELEKIGNESWPLCGFETYEGERESMSWTAQGIWSYNLSKSDMDLTNTPPANQPREIPEAQPDLTAENTALKAKVAELEVLLRQSYKENSEAWKVAVKWQRVAAKGIQR